RSAGRQIVRPDLRHEALQRPAEQLAAEGPPQLVPGHGRVLPQEAPEAAIAQRVEEIAGLDVGFAITLARERQDRIRSGLNPAVNQAREMDAEKGEPRVGNRIDEIPDEGLPLRPDLVILSAERHDAQVATLAREFGHAIAVQ